MSAPSIILIAPQMGENIGAAARVMANFGLSDLRLVAPRDGWPNEKAETMAAGALPDEVTARVFAETAAAIGDATFVCAATARPRDLPAPVMTVREAMARLRAESAAGARAAVMFGPEASGLENADIALANAVVTLPVSPAWPSLNLAQAVAVTAYEWAAGGGDGPPRRFDRPPEEAASREAVLGLAGQLEDALEAAGYFWPQERAETMKLNLTAMLARLNFTAADARTLRGVVKALALGARRRSE